jgi:protein tyrosine phosphatase (PTP) superfamily phosphohydrolase (DUF442 family)
MQQTPCRDLVLFFTSLALCVNAVGLRAQVPITSSADPIAKLTSNDLPNFHQVSAAIYRSGQPTRAGMEHLKASGITTIINLRSFSSDRDEIGTTGLAYEHIYMKAWHPEEKEAIRFLQIVTDAKRTPVLVHCHYGSDRTGAMVALYRIAVQCWTKDDAIREMREGGFGFNAIWFNLPWWLDSLDIAALRAQSGILIGPPRPPTPAAL